MTIGDAMIDDITYNTILDAHYQDRYIPLQVWEEYLRYAGALREYLSEASKALSVLVPIRLSELECPLVSMIVWAKALQVQQSRTGGGGVSVFCVTDSRIGRDSMLGKLSRLKEIWKRIGLAVLPKDVSELRDEVDSHPVYGKVAATFFEGLVRQNKAGVGVDELNDVFDVIVFSAYCRLRPGTVVLCGQDQAPLYNVVGRELRRLAGETASDFPTGVFTPFLPFTQSNHVMVGDDTGVVRRKIWLAMQGLSCRRDQLLFGQDLLRLTVGWSDSHDCAGSVRDVEAATSLEYVSSSIGEAVCKWLQKFAAGSDTTSHA